MTNVTGGDASTSEKHDVPRLVDELDEPRNPLLAAYVLCSGLPGIVQIVFHAMFPRTLIALHPYSVDFFVELCVIAVFSIFVLEVCTSQAQGIVHHKRAGQIAAKNLIQVLQGRAKLVLGGSRRVPSVALAQLAAHVHQEVPDRRETTGAGRRIQINLGDPNRRRVGLRVRTG